MPVPEGFIGWWYDTRLAADEFDDVINGEGPGAAGGSPDPLHAPEGHHSHLQYHVQ